MSALTGPSRHRLLHRDDPAAGRQARALLADDRPCSSAARCPGATFAAGEVLPFRVPTATYLASHLEPRPGGAGARVVQLPVCAACADAYGARYKVSFVPFVPPPPTPAVNV